MIEETAQVVDVGSSGIWIETQRKSACGQCAANKGCGTSVLSNILGNKPHRLRVISHVDVSVGDQVLVGMDESSMLKGAFMTYIFPLFSMIIMAVAGQQLSIILQAEPMEMFTVLFAAAGFWSGLRYLRYFNNKVRDDDRYQPVILRKLYNGYQQSVSVETFQKDRKECNE